MSLNLTVAIASRNETVQLVMTVLSAYEAIKASGLSGEVFVVDNSDEREWQAVQDMLAGAIKGGGVRLVHEPRISLAIAIDRAHREAMGEYIFYTDAHTLIGANTLLPLFTFATTHERAAFVHAPIQWAHRSPSSRRTHFTLSRTQLGDWSTKPVEKPEKITWKGMPYIISKSIYEVIGGMGCCAEHALGWGVLRYLGIKPWLLGYENWALPSGVVYHFGEWSESVRDIVKYRTYKKSGEERAGIAYAVAAYVMGGEELLRQEYERANMGRYCKDLDYALRESKRIGGAERKWILSHQKISFQQLVENPPWVQDLPDDQPKSTISDEYRSLNTELHTRSDVKYGYRGAEQAERVKSVAKQYHCTSILDYGAGKQTLSTVLKLQGCKDVRDYDPAIPEISALPSQADLVCCLDVLEHIEPDKLSSTLQHLRSVTGKLLLVRICTVPCTTKTLPDGSDPHRLVHDRSWWIDELQEYFLLVKSLKETDDRYVSMLLRSR